MMMPVRAMLLREDFGLFWRCRSVPRAGTFRPTRWWHDSNRRPFGRLAAFCRVASAALAAWDSACLPRRDCGIMAGAERGAAVTDGWIVTNVEILGGKPCVRGTRLSVEFLLELAASGATQTDILARYPQLTAEGLSAAFLFAARRISSERSWDLPIPA